MRHDWDEHSGGLQAQFREFIDKSLERERLFREEFSGRLMAEQRSYFETQLKAAFQQPLPTTQPPEAQILIDRSLERERLFREEFSGRLMAEQRAHFDTQLKFAFRQTLPIALTPDTRIFIHSVDGHRVLLDPTEPFITFHMLEHGEWERPLRDVMRGLLKPGSCYIDVGANIGLHALLAALLAGPSGKLLLIEPHPVTMSLLRANLEINGLERRVEVVQAAAAETHGGTASFEYFPQHSAMSGFKLAADRVEAFHATPVSLEVPLVSLDQLISERDLKPDLVKIDVEGFELRVLEGARGLLRSGWDTAFVVEYNRWTIESVMGDGAADRLIDLFRAANFRAFMITEKGCVPIDMSGSVAGSGDILFVRNDSAFLNSPPLKMVQTPYRAA